MVNSQAPIPSITASNRDDNLLLAQPSTKKSALRFPARWLKEFAARLLADGGSPTPWLDAELLLSFVLKKSRIDIQLEGGQPLDDEQLDLFWRLLARRLCYEPIAYILESKEFFGFNFYINEHCLIPRPDTEVVVEKCLSLIKQHELTKVFDICTGSGAIAIALLKESLCQVIASDISSKALKIAQFNAKELGVMDRLSLRQGDLFDAFTDKETAQLIVSNPPYIGNEELSQLPSSVRNYEPLIALDGGDRAGLNFYRRILSHAAKFLSVDGYLVMEIGFDQAQAIVLLLDSSWIFLEIFKDLAGHDRGIVLQKRSCPVR